MATDTEYQEKQNQRHVEKASPYYKASCTFAGLLPRKNIKDKIYSSSSDVCGKLYNLSINDDIFTEFIMIIGKEMNFLPGRNSVEAFRSIFSHIRDEGFTEIEWAITVTLERIKNYPFCMNSTVESVLGTSFNDVFEKLNNFKK